MEDGCLPHRGILPQPPRVSTEQCEASVEILVLEEKPKVSDIIVTAHRFCVPTMRNQTAALTTILLSFFGGAVPVNSDRLPDQDSWIIKLEDAQSPILTPFLFNGEKLTPDSPLWATYSAALSRHTSIASCIVIPPGSPSEVDTMNFNWQSMKNHQDVEVCIFIIASHLDSSLTMSEWLRQQGYEVSEPKPLSTSNLPDEPTGGAFNVLASLDGMTFNSRVGFKRSIFGEILRALLRTPAHHTDHMLNLYYDIDGALSSVTSSRRGG